MILSHSDMSLTEPGNSVRPPTILSAPASNDSGNLRARVRKQTKGTNMKSKTILAGAAIAGLMSGSFAVQAHAANVTNKAGVSLKQMSDETKDVHSCKGQNSCKGKGGCKTGDNGCKGKNSCKGKGGCATDGSHPAPSPSN